MRFYLESGDIQLSVEQKTNIRYVHGFED